MSSAQSRAYHSITFDIGSGVNTWGVIVPKAYSTRNTWDDWGLVPTSRPLFAPPAPRTQKLELNRSDGALDVSDALAGHPTYGSRTGSFEFLAVGEKRWPSLYTEIMSFLHGRSLRAWLDDEPNFYYEGRFSVSQWLSEKDWPRVTVGYEVGAFKRRFWYWDPFCFENDPVPVDNLLEFIVDGSESWKVEVGVAPLTPYMIVYSADGKGMDVSYSCPLTGQSGSGHFPDGVTLATGFLFGGGGPVELAVGGKGKLYIRYDEGRL